MPHLVLNSTADCALGIWHMTYLIEICSSRRLSSHAEYHALRGCDQDIFVKDVKGFVQNLRDEHMAKVTHQDVRKQDYRIEPWARVQTPVIRGGRVHAESETPLGKDLIHKSLAKN